MEMLSAMVAWCAKKTAVEAHPTSLLGSSIPGHLAVNSRLDHY